VASTLTGILHLYPALGTNFLSILNFSRTRLPCCALSSLHYLGRGRQHMTLRRQQWLRFLDASIARI